MTRLKNKLVPVSFLLIPLLYEKIVKSGLGGSKLSILCWNMLLPHLLASHCLSASLEPRGGSTVQDGQWWSRSGNIFPLSLLLRMDWTWSAYFVNIYRSNFWKRWLVHKQVERAACHRSGTSYRGEITVLIDPWCFPKHLSLLLHKRLISPLMIVAKNKIKILIIYN